MTQIAAASRRDPMAFAADAAGLASLTALLIVALHLPSFF